MAKQESIFALSPGDITFQIVPEWMQASSDMTELPDITFGYNVPIKKLFVEQSGDEFCGVIEIVSIFANTKIHKDLIEELYSNGSHFTIYIRQRSDIECPKILRIYEDCSFYQQEFAIPAIENAVFTRYYFTNSEDPWTIEQEKLDYLTPVNQYIYHYAVSKAIKDLNKEIKDSWSKSLDCLKKSLEFRQYIQ